jgi:hypothetical protein
MSITVNDGNMVWAAVLGKVEKKKKKAFKNKYLKT